MSHARPRALVFVIAFCVLSLYISELVHVAVEDWVLPLDFGGVCFVGVSVFVLE